MRFSKKIKRLRCGTCGEFMKADSGSSRLFVPDSDFSYGENIIQCKLCPDKYGLPIPTQSVNLLVCSELII